MSENETADVATDTATAAATDTAPEGTSATPATESAPAGPTKEEIANALEAFEDLVDGILGQPAADGQDAIAGKIDPTNGNVTEADMAEIAEAFANLPGGTRSHTKALDRLQSNQMTALTEHMWAVGARAYSLIIVALKNAGKATRARVESVAKVTVNPTDAHVALASAHALAVNFLTVGEGVDAGWGAMVNDKVNSLRDQVVTYSAYLGDKGVYDALSDEDKAQTEEPTAPEVDAVILAAARLARGRVPGAKKAPKESTGTSAAATPRDPSAPRGDILAHIQEVFASQPVGAFLKVSEITKVGTSQYGAGQASGGAVSARIKSAKFAEVAGLEYVNDGNGQGVRKTA